MKEFTIFKVSYDWYEGEHEEVLLGKYVDIKRFENDLIKAKNFAKSLIGKEIERDYLGKGYAVECLPEYYGQIIWYMVNKLDYIECYMDADIEYDVNDDISKKGIYITKFTKQIKREELKRK